MKIQFLQTGEIVATHGVKGEMKVLPGADGPDFLIDFKRVLINNREYLVEKCRIQKTCNLLKLKGIDTIEDAQALRGNVVEIYRSDAPADTIFAAELIGVEVFADGASIGHISDVLDYPGNKVYVVDGEHNYMIPAVREFILNTDIDSNIMHIKLIEGMRTDEN
jgi:16S rRNA processing protein RimM